jgi:hypothetical protein
MARHVRSLLLAGTTMVSLLLLLGHSEAAGVTKTLAQTPVSGRLADGGTFHGRLTVQALTVDEAGQLVATGVLSGTATPAAGRATKIAARTFTTPAALLDLRGTCTTLVVDLAPLTMPPLAQALRLVPVVLAPQAAPKEERLLQRTLCTVARLQENADLSERRAASWEHVPVGAER